MSENGDRSGEAHPVATDHELGVRVATIEGEVRSLTGSVRDWIAESREARKATSARFQDIHTRITNQGRPQYGLLLTAAAFVLTVFGGYIGTIAWFGGELISRHSELIKSNTAEIIATGRNRFTIADGEKMRVTLSEGIDALHEGLHQHEAIGAHVGADQRMTYAEQALVHRRDQADAKFAAVEARLNEMSVEIAKICGRLDIQ